MRLAFGSDHAGLRLKDHLKGFAASQGHATEDLGTHAADSVDYPDFAAAVCLRLLEGGADRGVLVCGSGVGMSMAANRFRGIRAVLCNDLYVARFSRLHNDANVLCLPGRLIGEGLAEEILRVWLETAYEGGRHQRRVEKLDHIGGKP